MKSAYYIARINTVQMQAGANICIMQKATYRKSNNRRIIFFALP